MSRGARLLSDCSHLMLLHGVTILTRRRRVKTWMATLLPAGKPYSRKPSEHHPMSTPRPQAGQPISLTADPKLDAALGRGWEAWEQAARQAGVGSVARWIALRLGDLGRKRDLLQPVASLLEAEDEEDRAVARVELAELVEEEDDVLADTLWEGVLAHGLATEDGDTIAEATTRLASIAEAHGDPLAPGEYHLEFLNWRRSDAHVSDPEAVETAMEDVVQLARLDGEQRFAALFEFKLAAFVRLAEEEDDRATEGDWEQDPAPYRSWS